MARTNKYASVNFNDMYDKKLNTSSASGAGKHTFSPSTSSRSHGMLVLSRPSPKPQPKIQSQPPPTIYSATPTRPPSTDHQPRFESDSISLRPLGKTGSGPLLASPPSNHQFPGLEKAHKESVTSKGDKFVPPHLRPGFVAKKERPSAAGFRPGGSGIGSPPAQYGEDGRPKSGGGYEMVMGTRGVLDPGEFNRNRPRSSGTQPSSSGWSNY